MPYAVNDCLGYASNEYGIAIDIFMFFNVEEKSGWMIDVFYAKIFKR